MEDIWSDWIIVIFLKSVVSVIDEHSRQGSPSKRQGKKKKREQKLPSPGIEHGTFEVLIGTVA